jgi:hypothetical protein
MKRFKVGDKVVLRADITKNRINVDYKKTINLHTDISYKYDIWKDKILKITKLEPDDYLGLYNIKVGVDKTGYYWGHTSWFRHVTKKDYEKLQLL